MRVSTPQVHENGGKQDVVSRGQNGVRKTRTVGRHVADPTAVVAHVPDVRPVEPPAAGDPPVVDRSRNGTGTHAKHPEAERVQHGPQKVVTVAGRMTDILILCM